VLVSGIVAAGTGLTGLAVIGATGSSPFSIGAESRVQAPSGPEAPPAAALAGRPVARSVALVIPAIGVRTRLVRLGLTAGGQLQVPATTAVAGWYSRSPRPGAVGSAVIAGHIDSEQGPGVFFRLRLLRPRDRVYVRRADGTLAAFQVVTVRTYLKPWFPTTSVYGPAPGPQLRLITCGGTFDPILHTYLSNVIVYAVAA
jgi:Sortase domain